MTNTIPTVRQGMLVDDQTPGRFIQLDTSAWFAWLEAPTTTHFSYALLNRTRGYIDGFMTVRKERRQRGGGDWSVYRRQGRQVRKIYVGGNPLGATALTQTRLDQIATRLRQAQEI